MADRTCWKTLLTLLLLLAAPAAARADGIDALAGGGLPDPYGANKKDGGPEYRIRLGYWFPLADFQFSKDPPEFGLGTRLDDDNDLSMNFDYVLPTFELDLTFKPYGRLEFQFMNLLFEGDSTARGQINYGTLTVPAGANIDSEFEYRTVSFYGTIFVPILDDPEIIGGIVLGTRYIHYFSELELDVSGLDEEDNVDAFVPIIGASIEGEIYDPIFAFARVVFFDFTYGDHDVEVSYREWQAGVQFRVSDYFFVGVEWLDVRSDLEDGGSDYRLKFRGVRIQAQISF